MSDNSDRVHRHARWILECATDRDSGYRCWGAYGNVRYYAPGNLYANGSTCWTVSGDLRTTFRGLLHERLMREAIADAERRSQQREAEINWRYCVEVADIRRDLLAEAESARAGEAAALEEVSAERSLRNLCKGMWRSAEDEIETALAGEAAALERVADLEALDDRQYALSQEIEEALEEERDTALAGESAALEEYALLVQSGLVSLQRAADMINDREAMWHSRVESVRAALASATEEGVGSARGLRRALELLDGESEEKKKSP